MATKKISPITIFTFAASAGMAQTLTSTFQFTASGYIGTSSAEKVDAFPRMCPAEENPLDFRCSGSTTGASLPSRQDQLRLPEPESAVADALLINYQFTERKT